MPELLLSTAVSGASIVISDYESDKSLSINL